MLADQPYLSTGEAAKRLGVHRRTVLRWVHEGRVPGAVETAGGRHRIPESSLAGLIRPAQPVAVA